MPIKNNPGLSTLRKLSTSIACNFVDASTTSKEYVRSVAGGTKKNIPSKLRASNRFLLSTCLRHEIYDFGDMHHSSPYFYVNGLSCVRRLASIMVGLQSEIVGEREILIQITKAIEDARQSKQLNEEIYAGLVELIFASQKIRRQSKVNSDENYPTVASNLLIEELEKHPKATIAIVGGGYVADKFFNSLLKARPRQIKKILWINRSTSRIERSIMNLIHLLDFDIEVMDLEEGEAALIEADAVFCAIANSASWFKKTALKNKAFVIDVSYPQAFESRNNIKLVNISNTNFSRLVKQPVTLGSIAFANQAIDDLVKSIGGLK